MPTPPFCCDALEKVVKKINGGGFNIGTGEISGSVWASHLRITISDGWDPVEIPFNYCPFCGQKPKEEE